MSRETIIRLTDDLDGTDADETVAFSFRGTEYEIDLSAKNAAAFEKALSRYLEAGRRVAVGRGRRSGAARRGSKADLGLIRTWARENGFQVSDRGRIAAEIREAYEAAN